MDSRLGETMQRGPDEWRSLVRLPRSMWLPILAMGAVAIGAVLFNEWSVRSIRAADERLAVVTAMQQDVIELHARLSDAETGLRGYLLTDDPRDLEPYQEAIAWLPVIGARLRSQALHDRVLLTGIQRLESLRGPHVATLQAAVALAGQGRRADAMARLRTGKGYVAMSRFRVEVQRLRTGLDARAGNLRNRTAIRVQWTRIAIVALGILSLVLLAVVVRLLVKDFWRQEAARQKQTRERQRLEQVVSERTAELSDLTTHLQFVAEQEKAAVARNLHDELGGLLTAARMDLAWLQRRASASEPAARAKLDALASVIDEAMSLKRRVVEDLRPALLDHFGLPAALQAYFEETCGKAGLGYTSRIPGEFEQVPQDLAIALFRVGQESLTNIIRHARARNVEMTFAVDDDSILIRIVDDGVGIDPAKLGGAASHGLVGMRHRVSTLKGQFSIGTNLPGGTRTDVVVPRPRHNRAIAGVVVNGTAGESADTTGRTAPACRGSDPRRQQDIARVSSARHGWSG